MTDRLLTIAEASDHLRVHWQTVRNYIKNGTLHASKIGRNIRIKESDIHRLLNRKFNRKPTLELEIRYLIKSRQTIEKRLLKLDAKVIYHAHVIDHWYMPDTTKTLEHNDILFDKGRAFGLRVREQDNAYQGKIATTLEVKKLADPPHHDSCVEAEIDITSHETADSLLRLMNLKEVIKIDKDRLVYQYKEYKITIDDIKNFGVGIEIEIHTAQPREKVIAELKVIASEIGICAHSPIERSVTHLAMEKLAKF
jgi:predicted adenylyl cyclase CyaB